MQICAECGMPVDKATTYHPYAACLMFKACRNSSVVQANLDAAVAHGMQAKHEAAEQLLQLMVDCNAVYAGGKLNECGLCDAIDNDGEKYQSATLANWLKLADKDGIKPMLRIPKTPNAKLTGVPPTDATKGG